MARDNREKTNAAIHKFSYGPPKHLMSTMKMYWLRPRRGIQKSWWAMSHHLVSLCPSRFLDFLRVPKQWPRIFYEECVCGVRASAWNSVFNRLLCGCAENTMMTWKTWKTWKTCLETTIKSLEDVEDVEDIRNMYVCIYFLISSTSSTSSKPLMVFSKHVFHVFHVFQAFNGVFLVFCSGSKQSTRLDATLRFDAPNALAKLNQECYSQTNPKCEINPVRSVLTSKHQPSFLTSHWAQGLR